MLSFATLSKLVVMVDVSATGQKSLRHVMVDFFGFFGTRIILAELKHRGMIAW